MKYTFLLMSLIIATFSSCTDPQIIGLELQPEGDQISISSLDDTGLLNVQTIAGEVIQSDEALYSLLGIYDSPEFGLSRAGFSTQLLLAENDVVFSDTLSLDSAVLSLVYSGYYGDISKELKMMVKELTEDIDIDSTYFSDYSVSTQELSSPFEMSFVPDPAAIITTEEDTVGVAKLTVRLDDLGQRIFNAGSTDLQDNESFTSFFKGLNFSIDSTNQSASVLYFNLRDSDSKFTLYFDNGTSYDLIIGTSAARINHFKLDKNIPLDFYGVQSMGGPKLEVSFADINLLKEELEGKAINNAKMIFSVGAIDDIYGYHTDMSLVRVDTDGELFFLSDSFTGDFGGTVDSDNQTYTFQIRKFLQEVMDGSHINESLYLLPVGPSINANKTILSPEVKLEIIYTEF
jgi:hypothetical protein